MTKPLSQVEISKRLNAAIERLGMPFDEERASKAPIGLLVPEVEKLIKEAVRAEKSRQRTYSE